MGVGAAVRSGGGLKMKREGFRPPRSKERQRTQLYMITIYNLPPDTILVWKLLPNDTRHLLSFLNYDYYHAQSEGDTDDHSPMTNPFDRAEPCIAHAITFHEDP